MTFERGNIGFFLAFLVLGGILGSALGALIVKVFPSLSVIKLGLTSSLSFNLEIISFGIRLDLSSIVGLVIGIFVFKKV
jgi:hypothetical protein